MTAPAALPDESNAAGTDRREYRMTHLDAERAHLARLAAPESRPSQAACLRWAAHVLAGLPAGHAPVHLHVNPDGRVDFQVGPATDEQLTDTVDAISVRAVLPPAHAQGMVGGTVHYGTPYADIRHASVYAAMSPRYAADWLDRQGGAA